MKALRISALILAVVLALGMLTACGSGKPEETSAQDTQPEVTTEEETTTAETLPEADPATLGTPAQTYVNSAGSTLESYTGIERSVFPLICGFFENSGYTEYSRSDINDLNAATYTKDGEVKHIYYVPTKRELNITTDPAGVSTLPEQSNFEGEGVESVVTQLQAAEINGMGYIIRLADGSFIIYDGGYNTAKSETTFWTDIAALNNGSEENVRVRAWIITHSHNDHYPLFTRLSKSDKAAANIKVDTIIYSPLASDARKKDDGTGTTYFNAKFKNDLDRFKNRGATVCIAHTGMSFHIVNMNIQILMTADELFIDENYDNFNNSSLVSRVTADGGKSMLLLADAAKESAAKLYEFYGNELKSDMVQAAHHGVEDFPIEVYNVIQAEITFYPCSQSLYDLTDRDANVRQAIREAAYTKEVLVREKTDYTRSFNK